MHINKLYYLINIICKNSLFDKLKYQLLLLNGKYCNNWCRGHAKIIVDLINELNIYKIIVAMMIVRKQNYMI